MAAGGVYVKVKKSQFILDKWPNATPYNWEDISSQIIDFLVMNYEYERDDAEELIEWYWQDEEDTAFIEKVKKEFLESGLFPKEVIG